MARIVLEFGRQPVLPDRMLRVPVDVVKIGGESWMANQLWDRLEGFRLWWNAQFNVAIYVGRVEHWKEAEESMLSELWMDTELKHPTLFFLEQQRVGPAGKYLGESYGMFATVAGLSDYAIDIAKHELLHMLGLSSYHNEDSFMHPSIEEGRLLPVLPQERTEVRDYIIRNGLG